MEARPLREAGRRLYDPSLNSRIHIEPDPLHRQHFGRSSTLLWFPAIWHLTKLSRVVVQRSAYLSTKEASYHSLKNRRVCLRCSKTLTVRGCFDRLFFGIQKHKIPE